MVCESPMAEFLILSSSFALFNIIVLVRSILFKLGSVLPGLTGDVETRKLLDFFLTKADNYQR